MTNLPPIHADIGYPRNQLADRLDACQLEDWTLEFVVAMIALFDLHFAEGGTNRAPVLELVKR
jgi:hypothetical protein